MPTLLSFQARLVTEYAIAPVEHYALSPVEHCWTQASVCEVVR
jgi:hypothetical protein